jgi:hypothetical protein
VTSLAIWMTFLYHKRIRLFLFGLGRAGTFGPWRRRARRVEERITAFRAKEMEFVVESLAENWVIECNESRLDNGCLAVVASMCEFLSSAKVSSTPYKTHIMVVQMTIWPSVKFIAADVL